MTKRPKEEVINTLTHATGTVLALAGAAILIASSLPHGRKMVFGMSVFAAGMIFMYLCSTLYHWWMPGKGKRLWRIFDHTSIYVMIAASYTPICIGVVGGLHGWLVFGALWGTTLAGTVYKAINTGRHPRLSLAVYLAMGWSIVFIAVPVFTRLSAAMLSLIAAEGLFYTTGTYFFAHDKRRFFHGIWHLFVLAGSVSHWLALFLMLREG